LTRNPLDPQFYRQKEGYKPAFDLYFESFSCEFEDLSWSDPTPFEFIYSMQVSKGKENPPLRARLGGIA
jgi:hypothetical protein